MPNIFEDEFTGRLDLSSAETAMYAYDIDPGDWLPYHYEYVEEWLIVVEGAVVVRIPGDEVELGRGAVMRFAPGPEGAHQITARGLDKARVLLFSRAAEPAVSVYPGTDSIGVWPDDDTEFYFKRSSAVSREDAV